MRVWISGSWTSSAWSRLRSLMAAIERPRDVAVDPFRVGGEQDRLAARSEFHPLVSRRKESAAPARLAAVGVVLAREQDDEGGKVAVLAPEPVTEPRAETGPADHLVAGVHEDLRRRVIELRRAHRAHDRDVVGDFRKIGQQFRDLRSRLSVFLELEWRSQQLRRALDEGEALAFDELLGDVFPVVPGEGRLGIEEIDLGWRPGHEQIDDSFDLGREMEAGVPRAR